MAVKFHMLTQDGKSYKFNTKNPAQANQRGTKMTIMETLAEMIEELEEGEILTEEDIDILRFAD